MWRLLSLALKNITGALPVVSESEKSALILLEDGADGLKYLLRTPKVHLKRMPEQRLHAQDVQYTIANGRSVQANL